MAGFSFSRTAGKLTRRQLLGAAALSALGASRVAAASKPGADGLYDEPWLLKSRDLAKEFAAAMQAGKQFMVLWEMRGCPWCRLMHTENFEKPEIVAYIQKHFAVMQLDLTGTGKLTGFDGKPVTDSTLALAHEVNSTPTVQFFVPEAATPGRELGRVGYLKPDEFLGMLRFVKEKGYEEGPFDEWLAKHR